MPPKMPAPGSPEDWLRHARSDLSIAGQQRASETLLETLCFHAQQAAEEGIKAVLVHFGVPRGVNRWVRVTSRRRWGG